MGIDAFNYATMNTSFWTSLQGVCFAFIVGSLLALTYVFTYEGLSYSKNFIQSLVLSPIVSAIAMMAIDGSLARGIGMMGAFSILRFRSNLKDPKDMFFLFASLALGISCGVFAYSITISGVLCFCAVIFILSKTPLSQSTQFDGLLRFNIPSKGNNQESVAGILSKNCRKFALVTLRDLAQGQRVDYSYQVKLKNQKQQAQLIQELQAIENLEGLQLMVQQSSTDI